MEVCNIGKCFVKERFCPWSRSVLSQTQRSASLTMEEGPNKD